ncbi:MAG: hypothetical protein K0R38_2925 [Polyangiaceae bacterium]|nr:hypothetical protein [Polyangiaceae bacterium]
MRRCLLALALLAWSEAASATTITWQRGAGADSCAEEPVILAEVEARLGRPLESPTAAGAERFEVKVERVGSSFRARIQRRDADSQLRGERVLSVKSDKCSALSEYAVVALSLMIDAEAALSSASPHAGVPSEPAGADFPEAPEPAPAPTSPSSAPEPGDLPARSAGSGPRVLYLYPAVTPPRGDPRFSRTASRRYAAALVQRALGARLEQREIYTVVEPQARFESLGDAESFARRAERRAPPRVLTEAGTRAATADYVLLPSVDELLVQDGSDYTLGGDGKAVTVTVRASALVTDVARQRGFSPLKAEARFSVLGTSTDAATRRFALRLGLLRAVEELVQKLRENAAFRIRPRLVVGADGERHVELASLKGIGNGDRFVFEDEPGRRSGYATVYDVTTTRASLRVLSSGEGTRLLELAKAPGMTSDFSLRFTRRAAYGTASEGERLAAAEAGRRTRHFDGATELGVGWRFLVEPSSGSRLRPLVDTHFSFVVSSGAALLVGMQGGVGYETPLLPALGLTFLPYVTAGGLFMRGSLGDERSRNARLETLLAASASVGGRFELVRLLGGFSLTLGAEAQYVLPLASAVSKSDFVGDELPNLHALIFQLGGAYRGSSYRD